MKLIFRTTVFLLLYIFTSCEKDLNVTIHGRIVFQCDGRPVRGLHVNVRQVSKHDETGFVSAITDQEGYYSLSGEVGAKGYDYFLLETYGQIDDTLPPYPSGGLLGTSDIKKDVTIDASMKAAQGIRFHLVNAMPFDSHDKFLRIDQVGEPNNLYVNYPGEIDTTITFNGTEASPFIYEYQFVKNNDTTIVRDSVFVAVCYSIPEVEILY